MAKPTDDEYIDRARGLWADDDLEIDDYPKVSGALDGSGAWVAAWVWVPKEEED